MAYIGLNVYASGYTGKLLIIWKEAVQGNPTPPETGRSAAFDFPYDAIYTIADINPVVHKVELWRSDDGVTLNELIKSWEVDAGKINTAIFKNFEYKVGRGNSDSTVGAAWADPDAGDTTLSDERLDGAAKDELIIHEAGYGRKMQDEYDLLTGGGIQLNYGKQFDDGVAWFITWSKTVETTVTVTSPSQFKDVEVVTADRDVYIDSTDNLYNKLVIINGSASVVTLTFPDLALIPNHTRITFNTHQGSQNYLKLQLDAGDTVNFLGQAKNVILLAKCEDLGIYFKDNVMYLTSYTGKALYRGTVVRDMDNSRYSDTGAYLLADESTGELSADDYPGLYEWIENLPGSHSVPLGTLAGQWGYSQTINSGKINEATIYPYKSKYGIDTVARTFRVPHLKGLTGKFLNTGEYPGRFEQDQVGKFFADMTIRKGWSYTNSPNINDVVGNGDPGHEENKTLFARSYDTGNSETRVKNYGEVPFIVL